MYRSIQESEILYQEQSRRNMSGALVVGAFVIIVLGFMVYTTKLSIEHGQILLAQYFIEVFALIVLVKQAASQYTYTLTKDAFIIDEKTLLGKKQMVLPYELIDGCYAFHQEFMGQLKFRYKYRKLSSVDSRKVWAMAYAVINGKKVKHGRLLLKLEDEFFDVLSQFLGKRAKTTQEEVVFYALLREDAVKHGEDPDTYLAQMQEKAEAEGNKEDAEKTAEGK